MNHAATPSGLLDISKIRSDFPILSQQIKQHPLVYFDNGASTQKPIQVIDAIAHFYKVDYSNVHRGIHTLSQRATERFENARETVRQFLCARSKKEIIFTRGTTESINLVAKSWGNENILPGDEILVSEMEHHSNIVPWQILAQEKQARVIPIPIGDDGSLDMIAFHRLLSAKTRIVAITELSNALGTLPPLSEIISAAHNVGSVVMVDAAQSVAHKAVNVAELDCDFYAFSGHKIYGPSGIGVLYAKQALLENMPPYQSGGDMISEVSFSGTTYNELPYKFEAGTPNIVGADGLAVALDYISNLGLDKIAHHEADLLNYATKKALEVEGLRIVGFAKHKASILSFVVNGVHATDLGTLLDQQGVAIRVGHHCAMPVMERFNLASTARISFGIYNTIEEIDICFTAINKALKILT
ncbi:MAG TPA: cysteine desulfurase CsdA [Gammaproteobacteria bacterium]|jgi:cysteine desulfurase / selenocysteine lyase|nr:cysteine desulfurase CsdA [Gammaproteobacteria bacterium]